MTRGLACLALLVTLGCASPGRDSEEALVVDLASELDRAEVFVEAGFIDIGTPEARPLLGQGWSWNEEEKSGFSFAWSSPYSSEVHFFTTEPRGLRMRFRCKPFRSDAHSVVSLSLGVNDEALGEVTLRQGWQDYDFTIPTESIRPGINRLAFDYSWQDGPPAESSQRRGRRVGVAWDWIRFPEIDTGRRPSSTRPDLLTLASGSQVDFYLEAPGETVLVIDEVRQTGSGGGGLEISAQMDGGGESVVQQIEGVERQLRLAVTTEPGLARVRFTASGDFEISRPRVLSTASREPTPIENPEPASELAIPRAPPGLILLYLIDTLRADHLTPYGYARDTSPGLARLMKDSVVFDDVVAHSSWTKPSTASILTGHLPWSHGAEGKQEALSGEIRSLAQFLQDAGFETGAFSANGNISRTFGFHHGFDHFSLMSQYHAPATDVQDEALRWLADHKATGGVFLYAHTIDPHAPYTPTERFYPEVATGTSDDRVGTVPFMRRLAKSRQEVEPELVEKLIALYDGEIAFNDRQLAELIESLESQDLYEQSLIMVVSDHGEEFYDHGSWTHGRTLHHEVLHVPLLIKFPGNWGAGSRIADTVQQIDLLPTILDYLALPQPPELPGDSLLCSVQQSLSEADLNCQTGQPRPVFSSVRYHHNHWMGVTLGDWKLILKSADRLDRRAKLFDRRLDPAETENVADRHPIRVGYLASLIRSEMRQRPIAGAAQRVELDDETRERLEALGYLD